MKTWLEVKQELEKIGVKDTDEVRGYDIYFDADRQDFTHVEMKLPVERTRSLSTL